MSERQVTVHRVFGDACECMSGIWYLFAELLHAAFIWDFYHHFYYHKETEFPKYWCGLQADVLCCS